jgi:proteasome alpha subunit
MEISQFISPKKLLQIKREIVEEALCQAHPIVVLEYTDGLMLLAENPSSSLFKITELYDRIAFAGTGVYNDYEKLRRAGVQWADIRGFSYSRADVKVRSLAAEYSTILGDIFSRQLIPLEVEILVAEIGDIVEDNHIYLIPFTGGLIEERNFSVIGDICKHPESNRVEKNRIRNFLCSQFPSNLMSKKEALNLALKALSQNSSKKVLKPEELELVVLDRTTSQQRQFIRFNHQEIEQLIK